MSSKQEDERTEDVYHLRKQTEHEDDTYDHAFVVPKRSSDLSDYSYCNIHDAAFFQTSPSEYFTLRHWISKDRQYVYEWVNLYNHVVL